MNPRNFIAMLCLVGGAACLDDPKLDEQEFPCRAQEDCIEGEQCDAERFVCVPKAEGPAIDAGTGDAG